MKPFYLHIGAFKTGTTALQVYFAQNMEKLAQNGINYLNMGRIQSAQNGLITSGNGAFLARTLLPKNHYLHMPKGQQQFLGEMKKCIQTKPKHSPLLSSEFFCDLETPQIQKLKDYVYSLGFELQIIFCVREQTSYLESIYVQHVKRHHLTATPEAFIGDMYQTTSHIDYGHYCNDLAEIVGAGNLHIVLHKKEDLFDRFNEILNVKSANMMRPARALNISLTPAQIVMMLKLNALSPRQNFSDIIVSNEAILQNTKHSSGITLIPDELRAEITAHYAESNAIFFDKWAKGHTHFAAEEKIFHSISDIQNQMSLEDIIATFGGLLVKYEDRLTRIENTLQQLINNAKRPQLKN